MLGCCVNTASESRLVFRDRALYAKVSVKPRDLVGIRVIKFDFAFDDIARMRVASLLESVRRRYSKTWTRGPLTAKSVSYWLLLVELREGQRCTTDRWDRAVF